MLEALFITGVDDITVSGLTQWDRGQMVQITCPDLPELFEVHFANRKSKKAIVTTATATGGVATITLPDELLREPYELITWLYYTSDTDGETVKTIRFPVERRKKPEDYIVDLPQSQKTDAEKLIEKKMSDYVEKELGAATLAQESATNASLSASAAEASAERAAELVSKAPYIGDNGNWFIGGVDSGVSATGPKGEEGQRGTGILRATTAPEMQYTETGSFFGFELSELKSESCVEEVLVGDLVLYEDKFWHITGIVDSIALAGGFTSVAGDGSGGTLTASHDGSGNVTLSLI